MKNKQTKTLLAAFAYRVIRRTDVDGSKVATLLIDALEAHPGKEPLEVVMQEISELLVKEAGISLALTRRDS